MQQKIKNTIQQFIHNLGDIRFVGEVMFAIIVLLVSWSGVKAIQTNYELQKQISHLQQEVDIARLKNDNLKLSNQYYDTDQFLELAARRQFGKAARGETVLVVPRQVALSYIKKMDTTNTKSKSSANKPTYQQNIEDWINFFFRKSDNKLLET